MSALFTATYPAMVNRLVLFGSFARYSAAPDYPHRRTLEEMLEGIATAWGKPAYVARVAASRADDPEYCARAERLMRQVASPSAMKRMLIANNQIDVRAILPQIRRPTLVLQRRGDVALLGRAVCPGAHHANRAMVHAGRGAGMNPPDGLTLCRSWSEI